MQYDIDLIDKNLVHKKSDENVLISNVRREIPHFLSAIEYTRIYESLEIDDKSLLDRCYLPLPSAALAFLSKESETSYMLKCMVPEIDGTRAEHLADTIDVQDQAFLLLLYEPVAGKDKLRLFRDISEEEEKHVLQLMQMNGNEVTETERNALSVIFSKTSEVDVGDVVYTNMFINISHPFFFEHSNDHVPGFMIIEAFRQFCVATNHTYGNVSVTNAQLILECLNSQFFKYAELSIPIMLKGYIRNIKKNKRGVWTFLDFEADIIQNNFIVAHLRIYGNIVPTGVFKKIRKTEIDKNLSMYRFKLFPEIKVNLELLNLQTNAYCSAELINISSTGFMLRSECFCDDELGQMFEFVCYFDQIGFIKGTCGTVWSDKGSKTAGVHITDIDDENMKRLRILLVNYCHVYKRGELF